MALRLGPATVHRLNDTLERSWLAGSFSVLFNDDSATCGISKLGINSPMLVQGEGRGREIVMEISRTQTDGGKGKFSSSAADMAPSAIGSIDHKGHCVSGERLTMQHSKVGGCGGGQISGWGAGSKRATERFRS